VERPNECIPELHDGRAAQQFRDLAGVANNVNARMDRRSNAMRS
jgi:hypothetical protein